MYKLVIQDDEGKTTVVPLIRDELTIGRKEGNTIRLTERNVSRQHARLTRANGTIVIEDLNSYNGIRVNGSRIQGRATINESDRVQIGDYLIEVRSDAVADKGPGQDETQPLERVEGTSPPATVPSMPVPAAEGTAPGVAAEPVALADTDPGRAASASISNHGRLVILSTNFAGQEFVLDKSKLVIGRTDDNDIWLNHRSISRHHAQVLLENGRYSIEDLQSSNGVRVNGEEYGKVELRRADVIDLGHVRLRFIEPGEDFVFGRDAQAVDVTPYSGGRAWLWITLAILALVGMGVVFFAMNSGNDDKGDGDGTGTGTGTSMAGTADGTGTQNNVQPDLPDAGAVEVEVDAAVDPDAENKANAQKNLQEAKRLLANNQLSEARVAIDSAKSLDPENPDILAVSKEIESLLDRSDAVDADWARFMTAVNNAQQPAKARRVREMAGEFSGTKYADQVAAQVAKAKSNYRRALLAKARRADDCDERDRIASSAVWPDLRDDVRRIKCKAPPSPGTGPGTAPNPNNVDKQKEYQAVIQSQGDGSTTKVYEACAKVRGATWVKKCLVTACRDQNKAKAQSYLNRLGKASRDKFINLCMAQGVDLTP